MTAPAAQPGFTTQRHGGGQRGQHLCGGYGHHTVRKITPGGLVTTLAGSAGGLGSNDGTGSDTWFNGPNGLAVDAAGNVYVADRVNFTIRKGVPVLVLTCATN